jgi:hypothetical protein
MLVIDVAPVLILVVLNVTGSRGTRSPRGKVPKGHLVPPMMIRPLGTSAASPGFPCGPDTPFTPCGPVGPAGPGVSQKCAAAIPASGPTTSAMTANTAAVLDLRRDRLTSVSRSLSRDVTDACSDSSEFIAEACRPDSNQTRDAEASTTDRGPPRHPCHIGVVIT